MGWVELRWGEKRKGGWGRGGGGRAGQHLHHSLPVGLLGVILLLQVASAILRLPHLLVECRRHPAQLLLPATAQAPPRTLPSLL